MLSSLSAACAPDAGDGDPSPEATGGSGAAPDATVIDGDTIEMSVDGRSERVRLIGVNTPESGDCGADLATRALESLLSGAAIRLERDVSDRDQYGRLLRYVFADDEFVNQALVARGLAVARAYPPDTARQSSLERAQETARAAERGIWDPGACGRASDARLSVGINADPPGNDEAAPNAEFVVVRNDGDALDLTGWAVRDESASNRFEFPNGFILDRNAAVIIHTGCGPPTATDLYWCSRGSMVWNNDGDTAFVLDPAGNVVVYAET
jgi:endonuclease YncB( thermonuclease family)